MICGKYCKKTIVCCVSKRNDYICYIISESKDYVYILAFDGKVGYYELKNRMICREYEVRRCFME